jgi:hypothetical protein
MRTAVNGRIAANSAEAEATKKQLISQLLGLSKKVESEQQKQATPMASLSNVHSKSPGKKKGKKTQASHSEQHVGEGKKASRPSKRNHSREVAAREATVPMTPNSAWENAQSPGSFGMDLASNPLQAAALNGDFGAVQQLLSSANVDQRMMDEVFETGVHSVQVDLVRIFLHPCRVSAAVRERCLLGAASRGDSNLVSAMLASASSKAAESAMHLAAKAGHGDVVRVLRPAVSEWVYAMSVTAGAGAGPGPGMPPGGPAGSMGSPTPSMGFPRGGTKSPMPMIVSSPALSRSMG